MKTKETTAPIPAPTGSLSHPAADPERGLTADELEQATERGARAELNLSCSDLACHVATNEFDLVDPASL